MEYNHRLTRREFLYLSAIGMCGLTVSGIPEAGYGAEKKAKYGGRMKVAYPFGSSGLDAHRNQEFMDYQNYCLMYQALTEQGPVPQMEIFPKLAQSWEISKDGREYIFALRQGVKFHHGKELDSGDVKYSIERVLNPAIRAPSSMSWRSSFLFKSYPWEKPVLPIFPLNAGVWFFSMVSIDPRPGMTIFPPPPKAAVGWGVMKPTPIFTSDSTK